MARKEKPFRTAPFELMFRGRPCRIFRQLPAEESEGGLYVQIQFEEGRHTAIVNNEELKEREN